jgi:RNA polymerase sigma factor (sigma-70 family)
VVIRRGGPCRFVGRHFTEVRMPNGLTIADRERMLLAVEKLIKKAANALQNRLRSRFPDEDREDFEQDVRLDLWKALDNFDPTRGVKWSTYAFTAIDRASKRAFTAAQNTPTLQSFDEEGSTLPDRAVAREDGPEEPRDADTELHAAVGRQLAGGILSRLGPGHRRLVERVVFEGLTADQIAEQDGHPAKVVKANIKAALRAMSAKGLIGHVASPAEVAAATAPINPWKKPEWSEGLRRKLAQTAAAPDYGARLGRVDEDVAAVLELIRCDGVTAEVAAELIGRKPAGVKSFLTRAFHAVAA